MKLIVDTNIVFSGILNSDSNIGKILINSKSYFEFYSVNFLNAELFKHRNRLRKLTGLSEEELTELINLVTNKITFIDEEIISEEFIQTSAKLISDTDPADIPFVALTMFVKGKLWTGDKMLINVLREKEFNDVMNTRDVFKLFEKFEKSV